MKFPIIANVLPTAVQAKLEQVKESQLAKDAAKIAAGVMGLGVLGGAVYLANRSISQPVVIQPEPSSTLPVNMGAFAIVFLIGSFFVSRTQTAKHLREGTVSYVKATPNAVRGTVRSGLAFGANSLKVASGAVGRGLYGATTGTLTAGYKVASFAVRTPVKVLQAGASFAFPGTKKAAPTDSEADPIPTSPRARAERDDRVREREQVGSPFSEQMENDPDFSQEN